MKLYKEEEFIYKDCYVRLSEKMLSGILYAMVMCHAKITNSYGVGIYEYTRKQNSFNNVMLKIFIHPDEVENFQEMTGVELLKPQSVTVNKHQCTPQ